MDESRARALLRAERAEVATLLRDTEAAVSIDEQAPDSATDYGDEGLPLTEEATDEAVVLQSCAFVFAVAGLIAFTVLRRLIGGIGRGGLLFRRLDGADTEKEEAAIGGGGSV